MEFNDDQARLLRVCLPFLVIYTIDLARNWLRDYSQAMDTGTLAKAQPETIRILVWVLSLLSFGYATGEFEVTAERLGVYRPEEHIDK